MGNVESSTSRVGIIGNMVTSTLPSITNLSAGIMGNIEISTSTTSSITNFCEVDPSAEPQYFHEVMSDNGTGSSHGNSAQENLETALSRVKACKRDAISIQSKLRNEYFSSWNEICDVTEARKMSINNLDELISKIERQFGGVNLRRKIEGIKWAPSWSHKVFEFTFGENIDAGEVMFGMVCIAKSPDGQTVDAISSLYKLDFTLAEERVVTEETANLFGILPVARNTRVDYRQRDLGHFSKKQLTNFCRVKALESFENQGLIRRVSFVDSLSAVDN